MSTWSSALSLAGKANARPAASGIELGSDPLIGRPADAEAEAAGARIPELAALAVRAPMNVSNGNESIARSNVLRSHISTCRCKVQLYSVIQLVMSYYINLYTVESIGER